MEGTDYVHSCGCSIVVRPRRKTWEIETLRSVLEHSGHWKQGAEGRRLKIMKGVVIKFKSGSLLSPLSLWTLRIRNQASNTEYVGSFEDSAFSHWWIRVSLFSEELHTPGKLAGTFLSVPHLIVRVLGLLMHATKSGILCWFWELNSSSSLPCKCFYPLSHLASLASCTIFHFICYCSFIGTLGFPVRLSWLTYFICLFLPGVSSPIVESGFFFLPVLALQMFATTPTFLCGL